MSRDALKTLFHPFASQTVPSPGTGERILFLGAESGVVPPDGFDAAIHAVQGFRPLFRSLAAAGLDAVPEPAGDGFDGALILFGKHRGENEQKIAQALSRVKPNGLIVAAGGKEDGVQPMRKRLEGLGLAVEHMPKYHGIALWFSRPDDAADAIAAFDKPPVRIDDRFTAAPGMFSHQRVDAGSELLAARLPTDFDGNAADFGAGWGFLSVALADRSPRTNRIDPFEADHQALEFARANMAENHPGIAARFFWQDLAAEPVKEKYDLVIMNPPFHEGHAADPALGQAMIAGAIGALRLGGRLMLVANRGLPYEALISRDMRETGETCRNARYKVLWGRK